MCFIRQLLLSLCLLGGTVSFGLGLKCYQCQLKDKVGDTDCDGNPPPEKYLKECAQPQCWMTYSNNGTMSIERFCVAVASNMNGCIAGMVTDKNGTRHAGIECTCNDSDGCNNKAIRTNK